MAAGAWDAPAVGPGRRATTRRSTSRRGPSPPCRRARAWCSTPTRSTPEGRPDDPGVEAGGPHPAPRVRAADRRAARPGPAPLALDGLVARVGVATLLKGAGTLVRAPRPGGGLDLYENTTGNPGMATAGAGDVLTGVIAALLAAGLGPLDAACLGAWLHGRAGDLVTRRTGWAPLIATDLLDGLIEAIRNVERRDA
ncbi:MAG: hypothetical protein KIT58_00600 [Planctomycetota bacterium]|nr:hypothetical protein [Planctomycetota bacterium]